jgi:hypothetical protein
MINNMKAACQEPSSKDLTSTTQSKDLAEFTYKGHHIARLQKISSLLWPHTDIRLLGTSKSDNVVEQAVVVSNGV